MDFSFFTALRGMQNPGVRSASSYLAKKNKRSMVMLLVLGGYGRHLMLMCGV